MTIIYVLSTVAFDSIVLMLAFLFGAIPGSWYKNKPYNKIQASLSVLSFAAGTIVCILAKANENFIQSSVSLYDLTFCGIFEAIYAVLFLLVMLAVIKKRKTVTVSQHIQLKASEYQLISKFDIALDPLPYMPNVRTYAVFGDKTILFPSARPQMETDADFFCRKISDNVYECISYTDLSKKWSGKKIISRLIGYTMVITSLLSPVMIAYFDASKINGAETDNLYELFIAYITFIFGGALYKLFSNTKGFGRFMYIFSIITIIAAVWKLIAVFI